MACGLPDAAGERAGPLEAFGERAGALVTLAARRLPALSWLGRTVGSLLAGRAPEVAGAPFAPSNPSQIWRDIGAAAEAPVPACSIMPTTTYRAVFTDAPGCTGPQDASQDVSSLPYTSAVPVLPPISVLIGEPSNASAPETA